MASSEHDQKIATCADVDTCIKSLQEMLLEAQRMNVTVRLPLTKVADGPFTYNGEHFALDSETAIINIGEPEEPQEEPEPEPVE